MLSIENGGSQPALLRDPEDQQTLPRDPEGLADILEASCILEASHVTEVRGGFSSLTHSLTRSFIHLFPGSISHSFNICTSIFPYLSCVCTFSFYLPISCAVLYLPVSSLSLAVHRVASQNHWSCLAAHLQHLVPRLQPQVSLSEAEGLRLACAHRHQGRSRSGETHMRPVVNDMDAPRLHEGPNNS